MLPEPDPLEPGPLLLPVEVTVATVASPPDPDPELPEPGPELLEPESLEPLEPDPEPLDPDPEPLEPEPEPEPEPLDPEPEPLGPGPLELELPGPGAGLSRWPECDEEPESSLPQELSAAASTSAMSGAAMRRTVEIITPPGCPEVRAGSSETE